MIFDVKYPIPLKYRRGGLRHDQVALVISGLTTLKYIDSLIEGSLADKDVLDFGCGVKFTQAILQFDIKIKSYTGIDVYDLMINYLNNTVTDPRLTYRSVNFHNEMYRPEGQPISPADELPVGSKLFDLITMQSVITHCNPEDTFALLSILKRYLHTDGELFFTCRMNQDQKEPFIDMDPDRPMLFATYNRVAIEDIISKCGYKIKCFHERNDAIPVQAHYVIQHTYKKPED